jgi:hypothetical protein
VVVPAVPSLLTLYVVCMPCTAWVSHAAWVIDKRQPIRTQPVRVQVTRVMVGPQQAVQVPKISRSWLISRKPCCSATALAHLSTAGPETSTVRPQVRQTRW